MSSLSKEMPRVGDMLKGFSCSYASHPWEPSCMKANFDMLLKGGIGGFRHWLAIFVIQYLYKSYSSGHKKVVPKIISSYLGTVAYSTSMCSIFLMTNCILRSILRGHYQYTTALIPGGMAGLSLFFCPKEVKGLAISYLSSMALHYFFNKLDSHRILPLTKGLETFLFMVSSAVILTLLRTKSKNEIVNSLWFYYPDKMEINNQSEERKAKLFEESDDEKKKYICSHDGSCWDCAFKDAAKYGAIGFFLDFGRQFISKILNSPKSIPYLLFDKKLYALGMFFGTYAFAFRRLLCYISRYRGMDSNVNSLAAGFLAGSTYILQKNSTICFTSVVTAIQFIVSRSQHLGIIPPLPLAQEILYLMVNGIIFHGRLMDSKDFPPEATKLMSGITFGRCDQICDNYWKIFSKHV